MHSYKIERISNECTSDETDFNNSCMGILVGCFLYSILL